MGHRRDRIKGKDECGPDCIWRPGCEAGASKKASLYLKPRAPRPERDPNETRPRHGRNCGASESRAQTCQVRRRLAWQTTATPPPARAKPGPIWTAHKMPYKAVSLSMPAFSR